MLGVWNGDGIHTSETVDCWVSDFLLLAETLKTEKKIMIKNPTGFLLAEKVM